MRRWVALVALAMTASACGGSGGGTASVSRSPSPATRNPTPSPSPASFSFKVAGVNTSASGTATVVAEPGTVSIELSITGLQANSSHVSHIHIGSCAVRGSIALALKQVVADGQGNADVKSTINGATYPPTNGTWYVVVHAGPDMQGSNATYLLCGNLFT